MRLPLALLAVAAAAGGCGHGAVPAPPPPDPAAEVRRVDDRLNRIQFPTGRDAARMQAVVSEMNSVDVSRCPPDYQAAVVQLATAVGALADYMEETGAWENRVSEGVEAFLRGFTLQDPFAPVREARERRRTLRDQVSAATANYQRTLAKYRKPPGGPAGPRD